MVINDFGSIQGLKVWYKEDAEILVYNGGSQKQGFAEVIGLSINWVHMSVAYEKMMNANVRFRAVLTMGSPTK